MGDEAEQAQDSQRGQDPVADGKAEQQDQQRRGEARRRQRDQAEDQSGGAGA